MKTTSMRAGLGDDEDVTKLSRRISRRFFPPHVQINSKQQNSHFLFFLFSIVKEVLLD